MKTSQIMLRDLNGVKIRQNHKTSFFNANDLLDLYNERNNENKRLQDYFDNESTKRTKTAILKEIQNIANQRDLENGLIETKRGKNGGTWVHPYLFIDLAMWLSPEFKVTCIKWIFDNLIEFRDQCGDGFKEVNDALFNRKPNLSPFEYANEAKLINKLVFGNPDRGQRNGASEEQLQLLKALQRADIKLINEGLDYYERFEKLKEVKSVYLLTE
uniref:Putative KilA-N domain-containing protein n=1 Tax=viral metagenome TaxID=1070528 RepID=A0A6M3JZW1_9ZZZZ